MNATKTHTPGPWNYSKGRVGSNGSQDADFAVAEVKHSKDGPLVAAAPELFAALQAMLADPKSNEYGNPARDLARAAIAKVSA